MEGMPQVNLRRPVVGGCVQEPRRIDSDGLPAFPRGSTSINTEPIASQVYSKSANTQNFVNFYISLFIKYKSIH